MQFSFQNSLVHSFTGKSMKLSRVFHLMKGSGSICSDYRLHLSFFQEQVLPLARHYDSLSVRDPLNQSRYKSQALGLWALFPCFCQNPTDVPQSLPKLAPILVRAMNDERYPQLVVSRVTRGLSWRVYKQRTDIFPLPQKHFRSSSVLG